MPLIRSNRGLRHGAKLVSNQIAQHGLILPARSLPSLKAAALNRTYAPLVFPPLVMAALVRTLHLASSGSAKRKQING